jgi:hypothetical protein
MSHGADAGRSVGADKNKFLFLIFFLDKSAFIGKVYLKALNSIS